MILYQDGFITLDYDPSTDVLYAACPDLQDFVLLQIHAAFNRIVSAVGAYDIKNLLLDFSKTTIDVSDDDYKMVLSQFVQDLMPTCVKRVARVISDDAVREARVASLAIEFKKELKPAFVFRNFTSQAAARYWLTGKETA
ncbi:hypothetical protein [Botryobacter ruber]|uniref:hypothetical protein n=1 Tax=Botryobacter ruber TaxID=2171629 RepID=UPI000F64CC73|nr:hypothetical protein [Botryobacter ruber]